MKILILKPSSLGDVIHALPVLRLLKLHFRTSEIYWWIDHMLAGLLEDDPDLAGVYLYDRKRWLHPMGFIPYLRSIRAMRKQKFDLIIDLQGLARSAITGWLANGDVFIGLDNITEGRREGARMYYDRTPPRSPPQTHAVDRYQAVLSLVGVPKGVPFVWLPKNIAAFESLRAKWQTGSSDWIMLVPGARWENKRWPLSYFVDLTRILLIQDPAIQIGILGSQADDPLGREIAAVAPDRILNLSGRTTLKEMIEWIRLCRCVVTNDTGPMHVAAALNRPVVALFGPTEPARTGPYGQASNVLQKRALPCVPCMSSVCTHLPYLECLTSLIPAEVARRLPARRP